MPSRKTVAFALAVMALAACIGVYAVFAGRGAHRTASSGEALIGGPFWLIDHSGKPVTDQDFRGRYMLIFFGYTNCGDICQTELQVMSAALGMLGNKGSAIQPIFISLDPERDRPVVLKAFLETFDSPIFGLTGNLEAIAAAAKAYHIQFTRTGDVGSTSYGIDHTIIIYLMGPDGRYLAHFNYTTDAAGLAADISAAMAGTL